MCGTTAILFHCVLFTDYRVNIHKENFSRMVSLY